MSELERPPSGNPPGDVLELLKGLAEGRVSTADVNLHVRAVLEKFDGDPPAFPGEKQPVERIIVEDGKITERFILKDGRYIPVALESADEQGGDQRASD